MKVSYIEGLANHIDPESCIGVRKVAGEALTGGRAGWVLSCEIDAPSRGGLLRDAGVLVSQEHTSEGEAFLLQSLQLARERGLLGSALDMLLATAEIIALLGAVALDSVALLHSPRDIPGREITATIFRSGAQAIAISGLVGFLIGIVLSYLSGQELRDIGAESYVVNLTGFAVLRELGPLLAAILNVGRSGSAMTAQIGVMSVTGELEAMSVLGISHLRRLVVPKAIGQLVAPAASATLDTKTVATRLKNSLCMKLTPKAVIHLK
jgi:hypothetical protein